MYSQEQKSIFLLPLLHQIIQRQIQPQANSAAAKKNMNLILALNNNLQWV
jgi:hypothetical protein